MACPDPTELARFALRTLEAAGVARVQEHVDTCAACRAASSALVTASRGELVETAAWSRPELAIGAQLDRFVILHELGEGAASVVYAAYDPELDRKVALKVLRSRGGAVDEKLLREGRALAKLSHPNVVGVYEVGSANGQFFIALELVEGVTVRQWVAIERRTWRAVRDVYTAAGRGLAALHREGLVHRDVKPDNIVVAGDGRARLVDFGLVGAGAGAGTPKYMAPEGSADARSDLFALAASLEESFGDARPPSRVRAAIERAKRATPSARHPSVDALLAELADRPRWHVAVPVALAVGALGAGAAFYLKGDAPAATCTPVDVWSAGERAGVEAAIDASGRTHAPTTKARVLPKLDGIAKALGDERVAACRAYHEQHAISAERFDRQVACLDRQQRSFAATVASLRGGSAEVVDRAIDIVAALPILADCRDDAVLARSEPLPSTPGAREAVIRVEEELARAEVAHRAGKSPEALEIAKRALGAARETKYGPVIARAAYFTADLLEVGGKAGEGRTLVDEAIEAAAAARLDEIEAKAWTLQLYILGNAGDTKQPEVEAAARAAEAAVVRSRAQLLRARLENTLGIIAKQRGDYAAARAHYEKALVVLRAIDPDRPEVSSTMSNLATVLRTIGELEPALAMAQEATQRDRETFGNKHPSYADALASLALAEITRSRTRSPSALRRSCGSEGSRRALRCSRATRARRHSRRGCA
ncbi:MAG: serine/threonine-protein kinase [Kofleriaceae bacterium]